MEGIQTSSKLGMWKVYQQKVHERDHTFSVKMEYTIRRSWTSDRKSPCKTFLSTIPPPSSGTTSAGKTSLWGWIVFRLTLQVSLLIFFLFLGGTDYSKAFIKAFDLFKGTSDISGSSRKKVIIFLTDGRPNDNEKTILQTIKTKNAELNNEVVIMTYGMLTNLPILRYIAEQEGLGVRKPSDVTVRLP